MYCNSQQIQHLVGAEELAGLSASECPGGGWSCPHTASKPVWFSRRQQTAPFCRFLTVLGYQTQTLHLCNRAPFVVSWLTCPLEPGALHTYQMALPKHCQSQAPGDTGPWNVTVAILWAGGWRQKRPCHHQGPKWFNFHKTIYSSEKDPSKAKLE